MFYPIALSSYLSSTHSSDIDQIHEKKLSKKETSEEESIAMTTKPSARTSLVCYGPIRIRRRHTVSSTLATGRRSKDEMIEGEDPIKRELRRMKNREAARRLKAERDGIERDLTKQVGDLEETERTLLNEIDQLTLYKRRLEDQYDQCLFYYKEVIRRNGNGRCREHEQENQQIIQTKTEPRSPSPQWQLLFHI